MKNPGYSSYINKWPLVCYLVLIRDDLVGRGPFLDDDTEVGAHGADRGRLAAPGRTGQQGDPRRLEDRKCMHDCDFKRKMSFRKGVQECR